MELAPAWPDLKLKWMDRCVAVRSWEPLRKTEFRFGSYFKCQTPQDLTKKKIKVYIDPESGEWVGVRNADSNTDDEEEDESVNEKRGRSRTPERRRSAKASRNRKRNLRRTARDKHKERRRMESERKRSASGDKCKEEGNNEPKRRFVEIKEANPPPVVAKDSERSEEGCDEEEAVRPADKSRSPSVEVVASESERPVTITLGSDVSWSGSSPPPPSSPSISTGSKEEEEEAANAEAEAAAAKEEWLGATGTFLDKLKEPRVKVLDRSCLDCGEAQILSAKVLKFCNKCPQFGVYAVASSHARDDQRPTDSTVSSSRLG